MIRPAKIWLASLALSLLATGCADLAPPRHDASALAEPTDAQICHDRITLAGRFSVQYRKDGRDESVHGNFQWVQDGANTHLILLSPLGQTVATIDVTPNSATLTPAGQPSRTASDADALAFATLGWPLPVSGLRDWLQACARNTQGRRFAVTPAHNDVSTPDGWHITYPTWENEGATIRPKRIDLQRNGNNVVTAVSLRLVIDEWQPRK